MVHSTAYYVKSQFPRILFGLYVAELAKGLSGCRSCLDIGCGGLSPMHLIDMEHLVGIDGHAPAVEMARQNKTHNEVHLADVRTIGERFSAGQFDACVALDLIEHLPKDDGFGILGDMERIAFRRVVIFTPNGLLPQSSQDGDLQEHLSGWEPEEMRTLGYDVIGLHGPRFLRGEYHKPRLLPNSVAGVVSTAAHYLYTRHHPEAAAALLCVKSLDRPRGKR